MVKVIKGLIKPINPYASIILGAMTFIWGLWLLNPFWDVFDSAPIFRLMTGLAPEWVWGLAGSIAGLSLIICNLRRDLIGIAAGLWLVSWFWGTVSLMMWLGDYKNTGGLTYSFICLWSNYAYVNVKINYVNLCECRR